MSTPMTRIQLEPGALDHVPAEELAQFLQGYGLELVYKPDGLTIRANPGLQNQSVQYSGSVNLDDPFDGVHRFGD